MDAVAQHDHVRRAVVLDLQHRALVGRVGAGERLGDDAVEPRALELDQPAPRHIDVGGGAGELDGCGKVAGEVLQRAPPLAERPVQVRLLTQGEEIEGDEGRRGLLREQGDAAGRGVDAL